MNSRTLKSIMQVASRVLWFRHCTLKNSVGHCAFDFSRHTKWFLSQGTEQDCNGMSAPGTWYLCERRRWLPWESSCRLLHSGGQLRTRAMLIRIRPKMILHYPSMMMMMMMVWCAGSYFLNIFCLCMLCTMPLRLLFGLLFAALEIIIAVSSTGSFRPGRDESCNVGARRWGLQFFVSACNCHKAFRCCHHFAILHPKDQVLTLQRPTSFIIILFLARRRNGCWFVLRCLEASWRCWSLRWLWRSLACSADICRDAPPRKARCHMMPHDATCKSWAKNSMNFCLSKQLGPGGATMHVFSHNEALSLRPKAFHGTNSSAKEKANLRETQDLWFGNVARHQ